jgi:hypothetical protein
MYSDILFLLELAFSIFISNVALHRPGGFASDFENLVDFNKQHLKTRLRSPVRNASAC